MFKSIRVQLLNAEGETAGSAVTMLVTTEDIESDGWDALGDVLDIACDYDHDELARDSVHRYALHMAETLTAKTGRVWAPGDIVQVNDAPLTDPRPLPQKARMALLIEPMLDAYGNGGSTD